MAITFSILLQSCTAMTQQDTVSRPWCNQESPPESERWITLENSELMPVVVDQVEHARVRLRKSSIVKITRLEAKQMLGRDIPGVGNSYLVRSGASIPVDSGYEYVSSLLKDESFNLHRIAGENSISIVTFQGVDMKVKQIDLPMILLTPMQVKKAYLACIAFE